MSPETAHSDPAAEVSSHVGELETLYNISQVLVTGSNQRQTLAEVLDTLETELDAFVGFDGFEERGKIGVFIDRALKNDLRCVLAFGCRPTQRGAHGFRS